MIEKLVKVEILDDCFVEYPTGKLKLNKGTISHIKQLQASKLVKEGKAIYVLTDDKMDASYQNKMCKPCSNKR